MVGRGGCVRVSRRLYVGKKYMEKTNEWREKKSYTQCIHKVVCVLWPPPPASSHVWSVEGIHPEQAQGQAMTLHLDTAP